MVVVGMITVTMTMMKTTSRALGEGVLKGHLYYLRRSSPSFLSSNPQTVTLWASGPGHMTLLALSHVSISPKAEPKARTFVRTLYVEDAPGSRREGIGRKGKGRRRNQPKSAF